MRDATGRNIRCNVDAPPVARPDGAAASGAVGSVVGQLAKIRGCRAVGIAGGKDKGFAFDSIAPLVDFGDEGRHVDAALRRDPAQEPVADLEGLLRKAFRVEVEVQDQQRAGQQHVDADREVVHDRGVVAAAAVVRAVARATTNRRSRVSRRSRRACSSGSPRPCRSPAMLTWSRASTSRSCRLVAI